MKKKLLIALMFLLAMNGFSQINLVKDFYEGDKDGNPALYGIYKNKIYLEAKISPITFESYTYDGTTLENITNNDGSNTRIIPIYIPENGADDPMVVLKQDGFQFSTATYNGSTFIEIYDKRSWGGGIKFNGKYYFTADLNGKSPLFFTDGTAAGTGYLKEDVKTYFSFQVTERAVVNNALIFAADTPEQGTELWKTDGTEAGTVLLKDIYTGDKDSDPEDFFVTADKSKLFFTAKTVNEGREIWVTDGTESGTKMLKDIHSGTRGDDINSMIEMNGNIYFEANGKLWKTDGTSENTIEIADAEERYLIILNNELYFHDSRSMFKTDGTPAGTSKVNPDSVGVEWGSFPKLYKNEIYFGGSVLDSRGQLDDEELWKTDGTPEGTVLVKNINTHTGAGNQEGLPNRFQVVGEELIFSAVTEEHGQEYWKTDGTESGTQLITDLAPGTLGFAVDIRSSSRFITFNNFALFAGGDASNGLGKELYVYKNGATASTKNNLLENIDLFYASNEIFIRGLESKNINLQVYNILGKKLISKDLDTSYNTTVQINLKQGIYIARIKTNKGQLLSKKFVVGN